MDLVSDFVQLFDDNRLQVFIRVNIKSGFIFAANWIPLHMNWRKHTVKTKQNKTTKKPTRTTTTDKPIKATHSHGPKSSSYTCLLTHENNGFGMPSKWGSHLTEEISSALGRVLRLICSQPLLPLNWYWILGTASLQLIHFDRSAIETICYQTWKYSQQSMERFPFVLCFHPFRHHVPTN